MVDRRLKAQALLNHWRAEANKLPLPTMEGEWCISPAGVRFLVQRGVEQCTGAILLWWELCSPQWTPLGIVFRDRKLS